MSSEKFTAFEGQKYLCIETYRKNGQGVQTPVWFVTSDEVIYIATAESSGKVKRLTHNKNVRIVPCNIKGEPKGKWIEGQAFFGNNSELNRTILLRNEKYGLMAKVIGILSSRKGKIVSIGIKI